MNNTTETPLMDEQQFEDYIKQNMYNPDGSLKLQFQTFTGVNNFRSVRRAIKRGHISIQGYIYPKRPFGNTNSATNVLKKKIYERIKSSK